MRGSLRSLACARRCTHAVLQARCYSVESTSLLALHHLLTSRPSPSTSAVHVSLSHSGIIKRIETKRDHRQARTVLGATSVGRACHKNESLLRLPDKDSGFDSSLSCGRKFPFRGYCSCFFCRQSNSTSSSTSIAASFPRCTPTESHNWTIRQVQLDLLRIFRRLYHQPDPSHCRLA